MAVFFSFQLSLFSSRIPDIDGLRPHGREITVPGDDVSMLRVVDVKTTKNGGSRPSVDGLGDGFVGVYSGREGLPKLVLFSS
jgi:hypothetical protein